MLLSLSSGIMAFRWLAKDTVAHGGGRSLKVDVKGPKVGTHVRPLPNLF